MNYLLLSLLVMLTLQSAVLAKNFKQLNGVKMLGPRYTTTNSTRPSFSRCLMQCYEDNCMGINWRSADGTCQVYHDNDGPSYEGMDFEENSSWISYYRVEQLTANRMVESSSDCPIDWVFSSLTGSCYLYVPDAKSFDDMMEYCQSIMPGYSKVLLLDNVEEDDYIMNNIMAVESSGNIVVGMQRALNKQWFAYSSQNSWPMIHQNWYGSEPNNVAEECVCKYLPTHQGEWNDYGCTGTYQGICEIDVMTPGVDKLYYY